jgi:hypothetical protein
MAIFQAVLEINCSMMHSCQDRAITGESTQSQASIFLQHGGMVENSPQEAHDKEDRENAGTDERCSSPALVLKVF